VFVDHGAFGWRKRRTAAHMKRYNRMFIEKDPTSEREIPKETIPTRT
jgi:hypothetical protein